MASITYVGQIEAINPDTKTIYIEFLPIKKENKGEMYTVELKKTPTALTNFLKKIGAKPGTKNSRISSYSKYAKELLDKKLGEIFVDKKNIQKLINSFNITTRAMEGLIRFSKKVKLNSPVKIGETIYPANAVLKFSYEG